MRLLFVVHRYAPFPGGSEIYVQNMAEESKRRGHDVVVFAGEHQGNYNDVIVTSNTQVLTAPWDLVVVHGGDVNVQNFVLSNAKNIPAPILYMLVLPSNSQVCLQALQECAYIGCSTQQDWDHVKRHNVVSKSFKIRHGVEYNNCIGIAGFKVKHNIEGKMFLSCGGYWPNKLLRELAHLFEISDINGTLVTTGYDNRMNLMPFQTDKVKPMLIDDRKEVLSAIHDADCLLMHSSQEGFGLVLLEASLNKIPWIARRIAGANELSSYGHTYTTDKELVYLMRNLNHYPFDLDITYDYVVNNHLIKNTIDDIEVIGNLT